MRSNRLRELLAAGELAVTAWVSTGDPYTAEVLGHCGFDAITIDLQHGMFGVESAIRCLQAVSATPSVPIVRCRSNDAGDIGHLLDAGAYGVICPNIDTVESAQRFVGACRYPPAGRRSYGPSRGLLYGGPDYAEHADAILAVDGLDAIYVGPSDLSVDAGWEPPAGDVSDRLAERLQHIAGRAAAAGVAAGIFASTLDQGVLFASWGYRLITTGNDVGLLRAESAWRLAALRDVR